MENLRIGIVGNIGVGKSTLVDAASRPPLSNILLDSFPGRDGTEKIKSFQEDINPVVLEAFYKDPVATAFMAQIEFFNSRLDRQRKIQHFRGIVLEDRTISEDYYIFGMAQKILGHMSEAEFQAYQRTYEMMTEKIPPPDLIVYLKADVPSLVRRIAQRARDGEDAIPEPYLETLNELYEQFISRHAGCPVLTIDTRDANGNMEDYLHDIVINIAKKIELLDLRVTTPGMTEWVMLPETKATLKAIESEKKLQQYLQIYPKLITIAGNVGLGKSTLAAIMEQSLGIKALYENPEDNPLLEKFLKDKKAYCYDLQLHFLKMRSAHRKKAKESEISYVKDRSLAEDLLVFCHQFNKEGYLTDRELELLAAAFKKENSRLPSADLIIVLKGSPELAWRRIQQRGREMEVEGGWSRSEIRALGEWYKTYASDVVRFGFHKGNVLELDVDKLDLTNRIHVGYVFSQIFKALTKGEKGLKDFVELKDDPETERSVELTTQESKYYDEL